MPIKQSYNIAITPIPYLLGEPKRLLAGMYPGVDEEAKTRKRQMILNWSAGEVR